ncbi:exopeptidase [Aureococcus anophagefferens]|nr:exopeptidase [Aureococcus anophagefferens]
MRLPLLLPGALAALLPLERVLIDTPEPQLLRSHMYNLTQFDHLMASPGDHANARYVRDELRRLGFDAEIQEVPVMTHLPAGPPTLSAVADGAVVYEAKLAEDVLAADPTSDNWYRNMTFNAYAPSGDVAARVVYANFGMPSDFDALEAAGVDVRGKIALTRYGGCFRGLKAMNAEARGAVATLIYSDPQQDGFTWGPTNPAGPWRPPQGVQRGSAQYLSLCAGDPFRLYLDADAPDPCGNVSYVPKHPVLPLSYEDALPILELLGGPAAPASFAGGLAVAYALGPSRATFRLHVDNEYAEGAVPNVVATLAGDDAAFPRPVYAGNHRDAWVLGAVDPHSGTAARALAAARDAGWRPRRTVVLCSWSGEEYGLLGSTAYAELEARGALEHATAYVNVDVAVGGNATLRRGDPVLDGLFAAAAADAHVVRGGAAVALDELWVAAGDSEDGKAAIDGVGRRPRAVFYPRRPTRSYHVGVSKLGTLGSGSDYTAFVDHLGIPSLDFSFQGPAGTYGTYHSVYDSYAYVDAVIDPDWEHHAAAARLLALLVFRLADARVLPVAPTTEARAVAAYVNELEQYANGTLGVAPLRAAAASFAGAAACAEAAAAACAGAACDDANDHLALFERRFLGAGRRPAPGYYLGYGATSFPGPVHAVEDGRLAEADAQVREAADRVDAAAAYLREICG